MKWMPKLLVLVVLLILRIPSECSSQTITNDTICIPISQLKKSIVDIQKGRYNGKLLINCEKKVDILEQNLKSKDSIIMYADRMYIAETKNSAHYRTLDSLNRIQMKSIKRQNSLNNAKGYIMAAIMGVFGYFVGNR